MPAAQDVHCASEALLQVKLLVQLSTPLHGTHWPLDRYVPEVQASHALLPALVQVTLPMQLGTALQALQRPLDR